MTASLIVLAVGVLMLFVEIIRPGRTFPKVKGWIRRAIIANLGQAAIVYAAGYLWEPFMKTHALFEGHKLGVLWGTVLGYFVLTFIYYWWHRVRHISSFLWRTVHQLHHSPQRIEVITSFYKHPIELVLNGLVSSGMMYLVLGLSPEAALGATLISGLAELFYHWNVKTPHWMGYIIQRPEMHCVHHEAGKHKYNYGDLPLWDMLFGTFKNPRVFEEACGFGEGEHRVTDMLLLRDIHSPKHALKEKSQAS